MRAESPSRFDGRAWTALGLVTLVAYFTYFRNFAYPAVPFWDERYYIVDAQKYLHGVYFIDLHPPLGKLLVALGERLFGQNSVTSQFLDVTYYATEVPEGFSYLGYRFFPVLLGWLTAPLLFLLFRAITRDTVIATLLSGLWVFDNALAVHMRGALLEAPLMFFSVLVMLAFVGLVRSDDLSTRRVRMLSAALGLALGAAISTKLLAGMLVVFPLAALWRMRATPRRAVASAALMAVTATVVTVAVWEVHFTLARRVNPALLESGYYQQPSAGARAFLQSAATTPIAALPAMVAEASRYAQWYDSARPALDFCKQGEWGSPAWMWPIGARAVPYWWASDDNGRTFRYLYLQSNPVVWWTALGALLLTCALLVTSVVRPGAPPLRHRFLITVFFAAYCAYFVPFLWIHGVMFLYHYFSPLLLTFVLFALLVDEIDAVGGFTLTQRRKRAALGIWFAVLVAAFWFYKPLTYYEPMTPQQIERRALVRLWDLTCILCPHGAGLCTSLTK